jgi:hypothetical protein
MRHILIQPSRSLNKDWNSRGHIQLMQKHCGSGETPSALDCFLMASSFAARANAVEASKI